MYKGHSINKLQSGMILLVLKYEKLEIWILYGN